MGGKRHPAGARAEELGSFDGVGTVASMGAAGFRLAVEPSPSGEGLLALPGQGTLGFRWRSRSLCDDQLRSRLGGSASVVTRQGLIQ